jgi:hypothetical protein
LERWVTGGGSSQTGMHPTETFSPLTFKQTNSIVLLQHFMKRKLSGKMFLAVTRLVLCVRKVMNDTCYEWILNV